MDYRWVDSTAVCLEMRTAGSTVDTKAAGMDDITAVLWVPSSVDINSLSSLYDSDNDLYWSWNSIGAQCCVAKTLFHIHSPHHFAFS